MAERKIFFDTVLIITLVMSRLIWILPELKKRYGGKFYITPSVKRELITRPMDIKRFQFEALQALKLINDGVLEVYEDVPEKEVARLHAIANCSFKIGNQNMEVVQSGEIESVVCALEAGRRSNCDGRKNLAIVHRKQPGDEIIVRTPIQEISFSRCRKNQTVQ